MKLQNKKAIVTGANRSIGKAIAIAFAKEGADVAISYRSDQEGAEQAVEAVKSHGRKGKAFYADFSHAQNIEAFYCDAMEFLGDLDILVNNAAGYDATEFLKIKLEDFEKLFRVSTLAPMLLSQLAAKKMIEKGSGGNIINISSISGMRAYPSRVSFGVTKAALNQLTENTALELGPYNIRVNAIAPGGTPYEFSDEDPGFPLKRVGRPEDHAKAAVYLASDDSSWMTGQILVVDGGQLLMAPFISL